MTINFKGMEEEKIAVDERSGMSSNRTSYSELAKHFGVQNQVEVKVYRTLKIRGFPKNYGPN